MFSWADVMVRQMEHERKVHEVEQTYWMRVESPSAPPVDRWQWRMMNAVGGWLVEAGCRLQADLTALAVMWFARALLNLVFTRLLPYPRRLRFVFALLHLYQHTGMQRLVQPLLPKKLREMDAMLPVIPDKFFNVMPTVLPAIGERRARVGLLNGCVMPLLFGDVNEATVRVLQRNGCDVVLPSNQICCGALNTHNGESVAAKRMARRNIDVFLDANVDAIVVNAAGCGAAMKEYGHLLRDDPAYREKAESFSARVKDSGEFLAGLGIVAKLRTLEMTVTYQDPCHLAHGQRVRAQPRQLLQMIPGLKLTEMEGADRCCGSAGIYNLTHSGMSQHLLKEKMQSVAATGAEVIVAPNPGCMLQLAYGARCYGPHVKIYHLMDLLDQASDAARNHRAPVHVAIEEVPGERQDGRGETVVLTFDISAPLQESVSLCFLSLWHLPGGC